jgi:hypothetical protein
MAKITFSGVHYTSYDNIAITNMPITSVNRTGYSANGNFFLSRDAISSDTAIKAGTACRIGSNSTYLALGTHGTHSQYNYMGNFSTYMTTVTNGEMDITITYECS